MTDLQTFVDTSGKTVEGADGRVFTKKVIEAGNKILENKENAAEIDAAVSKIGGIRAIKAQDESAVAARKAQEDEEAIFRQRAMVNALNADDPKDREYLDKIIQGLIGEQSPSEFFNDTATTEIYTILFVGSVRCV